MKKLGLAFALCLMVLSTAAFAAKDDEKGGPFDALWAAIEDMRAKIEAIELLPGPQGEPGPQGATGPQGPPGEPSDINVIISEDGETEAAFDMFLRIEGIDGESTDDKHRKWIDVESWSGGMSLPVSSGGAGASKPQHLPIVVTKPVDKASVPLFLALNSGEIIPEVELTMRKKDGDKKEDFYIIKMKEVLVTSVQIGSDGTEEVSFTYSKIEWKYRAQKADGSLESPVTGGWDLKTNKKV